MNAFKILLSSLLIYSSIFAGDLELFGKLRPGEVVFGKAAGLISVSFDGKELQYDEGEGLFIFGFDRDAEGVHYLRLKFEDGLVLAKKIILPKRKYKIQRINNLRQKYVSPPAKEIPRIEKERAIIRAAREKIGRIDDALFTMGFTKPLNKLRITGVFGSQRILNGTPKDPHGGVDFGSPTGTPVYATADGVVRLVADNFYYAGNFVLVDHGQGLNTIYIHLNKTLVNEGDYVVKGSKIGEVGTTGRSTGPHLHWGAQWFDKRVDALSLLKIKKFE